MDIFGWIMITLLALLALTIIGLFITPFIIIEIKSLSYKINKGIQDKKLDIDKRSTEKQHRDEIKREKDFELANRKLDIKLQQVDKKIKIQQEKLKLVQTLKQQTEIEKEQLLANKPVEDLNLDVVMGQLNSYSDSTDNDRE